MLFWIIIIALTLIVGLSLAVTLLRGRTGAESPAAYDMRVYQDQLKEVDRDLARGVIGAEDAERTRAEVSRRILAADTQLQMGDDTGGQPQGRIGLALAGLSVVVLLGSSLWLYQDLGAPGFPDQGLKTRLAEADEVRRTRPDQLAAEADMPEHTSPDASDEYSELMARLRTAVAERPEDVQGLRLLARNEAILGNHIAAYKAQAQLIGVLGAEATASDLTDQADMMILAAGGYVSPEAEEVLLQALKQDPKNGVARYYLGMMFGQVGRPDAAFKAWNQLLKESRPAAPWVAPIRAQIEEMARFAGVNYTLPPLSADDTAPGPDAEAIAAANDMDASQRAEMIQGMVDGLAERLATEGGTPQEWARLLNALGVLGNTDRAAAIWSEAQEVFATAPEALRVVYAGAKAAGVAE